MNSLSSPSKTLPRRRMKLWLGLLLALIAVAIAVTIFTNWRMSYVPNDLDLSSSHATQNGIFEVAYEPTNNTIPINELHTWTLTVKDSSNQPIENAEITVAGDMPQHGHGLATQPQVTEYLGDGQYLVEGMKFQMGGWWVMDFTISANGQTDTAQFNLVLN
jgi:hypothetical protein